MYAKNSAYQTYIRRFIPLTIAYLAATALAVRFIDDDLPPTLLTYGLALLPALAIIGWVWAFGRLFIEIEDEYLRLLEVRKAIVATGFLLVVCTIWGALELFAGLPGFPSFFAFPIWCLGLLPGQLFNRCWP
jgi:hypothetical protein